MLDLILAAAIALPAILLVIDPLTAVPVLLALTAGQDRASRQLTARRAAITAGLVLGLFAVAGGLVFRGFGITMPAFQIAGGLLLLRIGLDMLAPRRADPRRPERRADPAISPLAVPILAGPGAITTVMVLSSRQPGWWSAVPVLAAIAVATLLTWATLRGAEVIEARLSRRVMELLEPIVGLLLAAIAIEFLLTGVRDSRVLGGLAHP